jgi:hypothetical protein
MKKDPLPAEFTAYVKRLILHPSCRSPSHAWRHLVCRWGFWLDGVNTNALPGYATCPKPTLETNLPAGWSYQKFHAIAREAFGTDAIHKARKAAATLRQDCGSGQDYGICKVCGKGHGFSLIRNGQPTALVTHP